MVSLKFVDNFADLQKLVIRQSERQKLSHIEQSEPLLLPMHFDSFREFLKFATHDCAKQQVQRFYDGYVERLRQELLSLKRLATEYLNSI